MNGQLRILVQGKPTPTAQPSSGIENRHKSVCTVSGRIAGGILPASERRRSVTGSGRNNLALLSGVLVSLPLSTTSTLGRCTLVTKGCPRTKVLASLAPLDFNTGTTSSAVFGFSKQPNCYVAHCTNTLVLTGNNMRRGGLAALVRIVLATSARVSRHQCRRTTSHFAAHDAGFESVGGDGFIALPTARQIVGKIDQPGKVGERMFQKRVRCVLQNVVTADTSGNVRERWGNKSCTQIATYDQYLFGIGLATTTQRSIPDSGDRLDIASMAFLVPAAAFRIGTIGCDGILPGGDGGSGGPYKPQGGGGK
jgi:hypothetical protein